MKFEIIKKIKSHSIPDTLPDGSPCQTINSETVSKISTASGLSQLKIEIISLENKIIPLRYIRNMKSFSTSAQIMLLESTISIVGLGGLGGIVTEILSRTGVGHMNLIDGDKFDESNLNRQFLSTPKRIGDFKAKLAKQRVNQINDSIIINAYHQFLDESNAAFLLKRSDVIVDCLDNLKTRFILQRAAKKAKVPLVSAAVAGTTGQVTDIFPEDTGFELIYGKENTLDEKGAEASLGCLSPSVTLLAAIESSEVIKILHHEGSILKNKLLVMDLLDNTFEILDLI